MKNLERSFFPSFFPCFFFSLFDLFFFVQWIGSRFDGLCTSRFLCVYLLQLAAIRQQRKESWSIFIHLWFVFVSSFHLCKQLYTLPAFLSLSFLFLPPAGRRKKQLRLKQKSIALHLMYRAVARTHPRIQIPSSKFWSFSSSRFLSLSLKQITNKMSIWDG